MYLNIRSPIPSKWIAYAKTKPEASLYGRVLEERDERLYLELEQDDILRSSAWGVRGLIDNIGKDWKNDLGKLIKMALDYGGRPLSPTSLLEAARKQLKSHHDSPLREKLSDYRHLIRKQSHSEKLTWDDLMWMSTRIQHPIFLSLFDAALLGYCSKITEEDMGFLRQLPYQCPRCWRRAGENDARQTNFCQLHKKDGSEYLRMYRLRKKIEPFLENLEEEFSALVDRVKYKSISEVLDEEFPATKAYLENKGFAASYLSQPLDLLVALNHPEEFVFLNSAEMLALFPLEAQVLQTLQRAEVFLSHVESSGRLKGWGGARKGSGRPRKFLSPSCHPESLKLAEIEGDRAN